MKPYPVNLDFSRPQVMAIINVTPDSFYAGSRTFASDEIARRVERAASEGANFLDVGGYSSRPGAADVTPDEEFSRVARAMKEIRLRLPDMPVSVDTFRGSVARRVLDEFGEVIINDISAGMLDDSIVDVAAEYDVPYIAMHMRGTPVSMQNMTHYTDVVADVVAYFKQRTAELQDRGVTKLIIDPGFGFAKNTAQNYDLLRQLHQLVDLGFPVLAALSRKSMIYRVLDTTPDQALAGSIALGWEALRQGATILRVHDVHEAVDTVRLFQTFKG
ncbi:MAG: dihydropteroate synthase [Alistipes sp.]